jgi:integrase
MQDGRWRAAVSLGWGKNKSNEPVWLLKVITGQTRNGVQERLKKILRDQQIGLPIAPERLTVAGFLERWLEDVARPCVKPKTFRTYSDLVRLHIAPGIGSRILEKLSPAQGPRLRQREAHHSATIPEKASGRSLRTWQAA